MNPKKDSDKSMDPALIILIIIAIASSIFVLAYWWIRRKQSNVVPLHDLRHMLLCFGALITGVGLAWWKYQTMLPIEEQNIYLQLILGGCSMSALFCSLSMLLGRHHYLNMISK